MTGGEEVKRKGVIHVSGVNRSSSLGSTHTHSVCASQHVFPIWFHPVPQHWLNADLFSLIFLLSHVLLFCSFFSSQSTSLPPLSLLSLSLSPAIPHVISLSPLTLISYPRLPLLFISVTQHLDLMLFLRCGFVLCVCVCLTVWCHRSNFPQPDTTEMPSSPISLICCLSFCLLCR